MPVSRLTLALLRHRYGAGPIHLHRSDIRRKELMHVGTSNRHLERKQHALSTTATFLVNAQEYDHLAGRGAEVGYYLYAMDKVRIFRFVWSRVTAGLPALQSIYDYYELHGIEEDDFAIETAERLWKRWRVEKEKERIPSAPQDVPRLVCILFSERQALSVVERLLSFIDNGCIDMDPRYSMSVAPWVLTQLTPMTHQQVARKLKRSRPNVTISIRRFNSYLAYNQDLRKHLGYVLKTTHAQPTPSAAS